MVDLAFEMATLAERLGPPPGAAARVVQFVAPERGSGTSTIALAFARHVAVRARRGVWLVELDLMKGELIERISSEPEIFGPVGPPVRASPNDSAFFAVTPKTRDASGQPWPDIHYLSAHAVGRAKLWVTRFRREALRPGQSAQILSAPDYWEALRPHADYVIVDAPSADRSETAQVVAPFMDANVLVVAADRRNDVAARELRDDIMVAGGRCAGLVLTRAPAQPPAFLRRILP